MRSAQRTLRSVRACTSLSTSQGVSSRASSFVPVLHFVSAATLTPSSPFMRKARSKPPSGLLGLDGKSFIGGFHSGRIRTSNTSDDSRAQATIARRNRSSDFSDSPQSSSRRRAAPSTARATDCRLSTVRDPRTGMDAVRDTAIDRTEPLSPVAVFELLARPARAGFVPTDLAEVVVVKFPEDDGALLLQLVQWSAVSARFVEDQIRKSVQAEERGLEREFDLEVVDLPGLVVAAQAPRQRRRRGVDAPVDVGMDDGVVESEVFFLSPEPLPERRDHRDRRVDVAEPRPLPVLAKDLVVLDAPRFEILVLLRAQHYAIRVLPDHVI